MDGINGLFLILFLISLAAAAFFCSAETAFIGMQRLHLKHLVRTKHPRAAIVARILDKPEKFLATVLLCINFFETAVATLGTVMAVSLWKENLGVAIATIVITILTLIFAELIPKSLAARYGEKIALAYARPIEIISTILYPFVYVLNHIGIRFTRMAGEAAVRPTISEAEFRTAITVGEAEGVWEEEEAEMLHNTFEFADKPVSEVMQPRTEVTWLRQGTTLAGFLDIYKQYPFSRFPVYKGTTDNVVGVLSIKDLLMAQANKSLTLDSPIDELVRPVHFVPQTKRLGELLAEMRDNNYHMVAIVDEYGGVAGIAALEQLTQDIMGVIGDELAVKEKDFVPIDAHTCEVDGGVRIEDANEELDLDLPTGDYETVAGFILSHLGRIPKQGENLKYKDLKITIAQMHGRKIEKIQITREKDAAPAP
ncbi:MAG: hemolysin family protein [Dehalococcoidia bacterium]|nr:hemolysin family protein [Dehalococcoidia bacterium]